MVNGKIHQPSGEHGGGEGLQEEGGDRAAVGAGGVLGLDPSGYSGICAGGQDCPRAYSLEDLAIALDGIRERIAALENAEGESDDYWQRRLGEVEGRLEAICHQIAGLDTRYELVLEKTARIIDKLNGLSFN